MPASYLDKLDFSTPRHHRLRERIWREWCFARVAMVHFRVRLLLIVIVLLGGGLLFQRYEPEKRHSLPEATYYTWSLVFGEPPEEFPASAVLQGLFFLVPIIGLVVIIEGIVDLALLVRDRQRCERSWCTMMATSLSNHIVLVGLGRLGFRTFHLLRRLGQTVVVIERDPTNQFLDDVRRDGSPLFIGDARREALLEDCNVAKARSVILATNDDLANLEIALDARRIAPKIRVVVRMFDQNMADKIRDGFNIHIAMSQAALSAPAFATAAMEASIVSSMVVDGRLVVMQRWHVREAGPLCGKSVGDILAERGFSVVERRPKDAPSGLFPSADTRLVSGDELLVQGPFDKLSELRDATAAVT